MRFVLVSCLGVSESGIRLQVPTSVPHRGALVHVRVLEWSIAERGIVRYVAPRGIIGVEFPFEGAAMDQIERWRKIVRAAGERSEHG